MENRAIIEALLFIAERPVSTEELAEVLELARPEVEAELQALGETLAAGGHGLELRRAAGGWRLATRPAAYPWIERYAASPSVARLSQAALESLAVVAYRQPVSRAQVSEIRGVDSESALHTLERRGLIRESDRLRLPGNPAVYSTTELFLEKVGVDELSELPPLADHVPPAGLMDSLEATFGPDAD